MQRSRGRTTTSLLAIGTAATLMLSACAGGGGDNENTTTAAPAQERSSDSASAPATESAPADLAESQSAASPEAGPAPAGEVATPEAAASSGRAPSAAPSSSLKPKASAAKADAKPAPAGVKAAPAGSAPAPAAPGAAPTGDAAVPSPAPAGKASATETAPKGGVTDIGVTADEVKFGGIYMYGWPLSDVILVPMMREQRAIAKIVNDAGGINGRKLTYLDCDDGFPDSARTRACYKKLVEQDKIFAFMGGCTFNEDQFQADIKRDKIPYFSPCSLYKVEWENPFLFPVHMDMQQEAAASALYVLKHKKPKTYGLICMDVPDSQAACGVVNKYMTDAGVKEVFRRTYRIGTPDMSADVIAARAASPDIIIHYTIDPGLTARFIIDAAQQDYWPPMGMTGNHMTSEIIGSLIGEFPAKAPGGYSTNTSYILWGSDYIAWQRKYVANNKGMALHTSQGQWFGSTVLVECLKRVGANLTRAAVMDCMSSQRWETGPGLGQVFNWRMGERYQENTGNTKEYMYKYVNRETYAKDDGSGKPSGLIPDPLQFELIAPSRNE